MTSWNVALSQKECIGRILGIKLTGPLGLYLGMATQNEQNKGRIFNKIQDKVGKTLQGWKENIFSASGKKILIN